MESAELGPAETSLKEKEQVPGCLARQFLKFPLGSLRIFMFFVSSSFSYGSHP